MAGKEPTLLLESASSDHRFVVGLVARYRGRATSTAALPAFLTRHLEPVRLADGSSLAIDGSIWGGDGRPLAIARERVLVAPDSYTVPFSAAKEDELVTTPIIQVGPSPRRSPTIADEISAWYGWRSWCGDDPQALDAREAQELTALSREALRGHGVDVHRREKIETYGDLLSANEEIDGRDREGESYRVAPGPRRRRTHWYAWIAFLASADEVSPTMLADLLIASAASWRADPLAACRARCGADLDPASESRRRLVERMRKDLVRAEHLAAIPEDLSAD